MPAPKELAARLVPLLRRRRSLWLPDVYYKVGTLLKKLLEDTGRERFDYNGHYLQRVGKILRKECGAGTPVLHSALCLVKTIDREAFADFRAHHVSWTALRFVLRATSRKCEDRPARLAEIRRQLKDYEPAGFTAYVRELLPGEKAGKPPKKGEPAYVVVGSQGWLHSRSLLSKGNARRVQQRHKGARIILVGR